MYVQVLFCRHKQIEGSVHKKGDFAVDNRQRTLPVGLIDEPRRSKYLPCFSAIWCQSQTQREAAAAQGSEVARSSLALAGSNKGGGREARHGHRCHHPPSFATLLAAVVAAVSFGMLLAWLGCEPESTPFLDSCGKCNNIIKKIIMCGG
jgi:hypothetical protein